MTAIRRLDAVLEPTKEAVFKVCRQLGDAGVANKRDALCAACENAFHSMLPLTLHDLRAFRARGNPPRTSARTGLILCIPFTPAQRRPIVWQASCSPTAPVLYYR